MTFVGRLAAALIVTVVALACSPAQAHHRCGHKRIVCAPSSAPSTGGTSVPPTTTAPPSDTTTAPVSEAPAQEGSTGGATPPPPESAPSDTTSSTEGLTTTGGTTAFSGLLSDSEAAARVVRNGYEPRPGNLAPNGYIPTLLDLETFRTAGGTGSRAPAIYTSLLSGSFSGTTDEILQWGAHKWGLDADLLRAVAVTESGWNQLWVGDGGYSYGLMQIKRPTGAPYDGWSGSHPLSGLSSAFNVDFYGSVIRACYEGAWGHSADLWGCVGSWYSGGWHDQGAENYIASVKRHLSARTWEQPGY